MRRACCFTTCLRTRPASDAGCWETEGTVPATVVTHGSLPAGGGSADATPRRSLWLSADAAAATHGLKASEAAPAVEPPLADCGSPTRQEPNPPAKLPQAQVLSPSSSDSFEKLPSRQLCSTLHTPLYCAALNSVVAIVGSEAISSDSCRYCKTSVSRPSSHFGLGVVSLDWTREVDRLAI